MALYGVFSNFGKNDPEFSWWEKAISISVSVTGFLSLLVSIKIWQDSDERQVSQAAISLFEKLRDERFSQIRNEAWEIRNRWYYEPGFREKIIASSKMPEEEYKNNALMQEMKAVRKLIEFYTVLSEYKGSEDIIKRCRYFHFGYWRPFLYEIAELHDAYNIPQSEFKLKFPKQEKEYEVGISYIATLRRMDKLLDLEEIPQDFQIHSFN